VVALGALFLGFGAETVVSMPDHASILVDPQTSTYLAPSCISVPDSVAPMLVTELTSARTLDDSSRAIFRATGLMSMPAIARREMKLRPNRACRDAAAFEQEGRSLSGLALQRLGILPPLRSRWNADGSWNW
jgi:hypothetical protein